MDCPRQDVPRQLDCELRDHGAWGVDVQVYREREFLYGRRWATRALALEEADEQKRGLFARAVSSSRRRPLQKPSVALDSVVDAEMQE
jgi:hypothetical protein